MKEKKKYTKITLYLKSQREYDQLRIKLIEMGIPSVSSWFRICVRTLIESK